ncbi:MAG: TIGR03067 domain-containing protein [Pyrinomonadaceae bacterium]
MKNFLFLTAFLLLAFVQMNLAQDFKSDADLRKDTEASLQGNWRTTRAVRDGQEVRIEGQFVASEIEFSGGKFITRAGGKEFFGSYTFDPKQNPMWITLEYDRNTGQPWQGTTLRGVFKVEGNKLTIVTNVQKRPTELSSQKNSLNFLMEFERGKN